MNKTRNEFVPLSAAVARLKAKMFASGKRPIAVGVAKKIFPGFTIEWGPQKERAAAQIHAAILKGDLIVQVFTPPSRDGTCRAIEVPVAVVDVLPKVRGALTDDVVRLPLNLLRKGTIDSELHAALSTSRKFLRKVEFETWCDEQKRKLVWPSQENSDEVRSNTRRSASSGSAKKTKGRKWGRPSKQTPQLLTAIKALTNDGKWSASDGIAPLVRLLVPNGAPNRYLVSRAVQRLYLVTGDCAYQISPRKRRRSPTAR